ncbi:MAG TPA: squalene/phytoene synthase family protein, partial [Candidatus Bilamarchaeaceae archaeon]|nr:squalene/phytoene synthase family protein [Candidatus Bilamarchaeaceae archaeon]
SDVDEYMYGSAEVIGLFMAKILRLPLDSYKYARLLGKAMQYTNFIRDVNEDWGMRRTYFPKEDFEESGLPSLSRKDAESNPGAFRALIRKKIRQFRELQSEAEKGFKYIPRRLLIPIRTASEMYKWTASQIYRDPFIVYSRKVKPSIPRIMLEAGRNALFTGVPR